MEEVAVAARVGDEIATYLDACQRKLAEEARNTIALIHRQGLWGVFVWLQILEAGPEKSMADRL